jgi:regulator of protease activity HflC (stomatin/prohibitin superfamily)
MPAQEAITRDTVTVKVNAVVYLRVVDPEEAVVKVLDYVRATSLIGQATLRSILGQSDLEHLLSDERPRSRIRVDRRGADAARRAGPYFRWSRS